MPFEMRLAQKIDIASIKILMDVAIRQLQAAYLTVEQIEASFAGMGLDMQLIDDQTYFCVFDKGLLIGCGGWSRRSTAYGGDHSANRDASLLDPTCDRARIRAMYTHPDYARQGIGRMIIARSEHQARKEGFKAAQMVSTLAGRPAYEKCGYRVEKEWNDEQGSVPVPLLTMAKSLV